jgi:hypothetical protein
VGSIVWQGANSSGLAAVLLLGVWGSETAGQDFIELSIKGELSPALRVAIANALDPTVDHKGLVDAFIQSETDRQDVPETLVEQASKIEVMITDGQRYYNAAADINETTQKGVIFAQENSDVARAYGARLDKDWSEQALDADLGLIVAPIDKAMLDALPIAPKSPSDVTASNVGLNGNVVDTLAQLDRDIEQLGSTVRTIALPDSTPPEARAELFAAIAAEPQATATETTEPSTIQIDTPAGSIIQTAAGEICVEGTDDWPYDVDKVARVLAYNRRVMVRAGIHNPRRVQILVVDSGLPDALAANPAFSRFLQSDQTLALSQGYYWANTSELGHEPRCFGEAVRGESAYGYVAAPLTAEDCVSRQPLGFLSPPAADSNSPEYLPDHGGLVGVIAVGGPRLASRVPELDRLVGLSFARVMRANAGRVVSDPPDVTRAFEFATRRNFTIVNTSLRIAERVRDEIQPAFVQYSESGLTVAAAGNTSGELQTSSTAFPASFASPTGDNDHLIVVGGVERKGHPPAILYWQQASFSDQLVDIGAPSVDIDSLDGQGRPGCFSGTSAAAPQVTFAAAMVAAFGYGRAPEIKRRLLATARHEPALTNKVRDGNLLDLPVALDVFVDLVWLHGETTPRRGRLLPPDRTLSDDAALLQLCVGAASSLEATAGWIDANRLIYWEELAPNKARIWHEAAGGLTLVGNRCDIPDGAIIRFRETTGEEHHLGIEEIDRIVPTRLRRALAITMDPVFPPP